MFGEVTPRFSHTLRPTGDGGTRVVHRLEVDGPDAAAVGATFFAAESDTLVPVLQRLVNR